MYDANLSRELPPSTEEADDEEVDAEDEEADASMVDEVEEADVLMVDDEEEADVSMVDEVEEAVSASSSSSSVSFFYRYARCQICCWPVFLPCRSKCTSTLACRGHLHACSSTRFAYE